MPRKPKAVPLSKIEDIQASLKQKAATPKTISLSDLVKNLAKPIQDMLDAGYDYEDVAEVFKGHGVELAASGLKGFHKKASTTDNSSNNSSDSLAVESSVNSDSSPELTDSSTATNDDTPAIEPDNSPPLSGGSSEPSPSTTTKRKKPTASPSAQFNVTDRSNV